MNALDATRKWLREECPLIDKTDKFNANYLGSQATEYTLCTAANPTGKIFSAWITPLIS